MPIFVVCGAPFTATHGQQRILINCAGIANGIKTAARDKQSGAAKAFPVADFERVVQVNLLGTFRCIVTSAAGMLDLELLESGERGAIVCTASVGAQDRADPAGGLCGVQGARPLPEAVVQDSMTLLGIAPPSLIPYRQMCDIFA